MLTFQDDLTMASAQMDLDDLESQDSAEEPVAASINIQEEDGLSFEYKYERARTIMLQNPKYRWVFFHVLKHCADGCLHVLQELEEFVSAEPGYERLKQPPFFPVHWLDQAYALEQQYLDADGNLYTWNDVEYLTEDEFDDLVAQYAYVTTDVGLAILEEFSPAQGIKGLSGESTERCALYRNTLAFACEKRSFAQMDRHIRTSEAFAKVSSEAPDITPGVFIDKLSALGGISYNEGWQITEEGKELLRLLSIKSWNGK